jgi:hypothetical protein
MLGFSFSLKHFCVVYTFKRVSFSSSSSSLSSLGGRCGETRNLVLFLHHPTGKITVKEDPCLSTSGTIKKSTVFFHGATNLPFRVFVKGFREHESEFPFSLFFNTAPKTHAPFHLASEL